MSSSASLFLASSPTQAEFWSVPSKLDPWTPQQPRITSWYPTTPQSLSPLRTSKNANLSARPMSSSPISTPGASENDQNIFQTSYGSNKPVSHATTPLQASSTGISFNKLSEDEDVGRGISTSTGSSKASIFQYEARVRSSAPASQLQSHTHANRQSRKQLFLDRLRTRRDDARFERNGEQVMRMEYWDERRAWERGMAANGDTMMLEDMDNEFEDENEAKGGEEEEPEDLEEMSPTEEKEIEELVSYFDFGSREQLRNEFDDQDDDDYDALFEDILNQESTGQTQAQPLTSDPGMRPNQGQDGDDMDMDMS